MATSPSTPTASDAGISSFRISVFRFSEGIQPDKLTAYLEMATGALDNDGMLQRFQVLVYPDHRNWEWRDKAPDLDARERAYETIERLANFDPVAWGAKPAGQYDKFPAFRFTDDAQEIFIQWSIELHNRRISDESDPLIQQHLSKYDKLFPALALLFHLIDCAAHGVRGRHHEDLRDPRGRLVRVPRSACPSLLRIVEG